MEVDMKTNRFKTVISFVLAMTLSGSVARAAGEDFIVKNNHHKIVEEAKKEGKLRVLIGLDSTQTMVKAFMKKYPFLEVDGQLMRGTEAAQRFVLELKSGMASDWDIVGVTTDMYGEYLPYLTRFDLVSMSKQNVLQIPVGMIDPKNRNIVGMTSSVSVVAYNKRQMPAERLPNRWEDFLKPEFKGRKFAVDIRPHAHTAMIPLMGLEWVVKYCRGLAAQKPIWLRGQTRSLAAMASGEIPLHAAINYHSTVRVMRKTPTSDLQYKLIEPVPVRISEPEGVFHKASHPNAALLWLEFVASAEGQKVIDDHEPLKSSVFGPSSVVEKLVRGKKLSVFDWETFHMKPQWTGAVIKAFGFPKGEKIKNL